MDTNDKKTYTRKQLEELGYTIDHSGDVFREDDPSFLLDAESADDGDF